VTVDTTWRCRLGREQVRTCTDDKWDCCTGICPHGAWVPKGETTRHWVARVNREWLEREKP